MGDIGDVVRRLQNEVPELLVAVQEPGTIQAQLFGVPVSFFDHASPLIAPPELLGQTATAVAQTPDLMAMKLLALQNRGDRKDFVDLFALITDANLTLTDAMTH